MTRAPPPERVKMPKRHDGKRVSDRWLCAKGHLHPGRAHAAKCNQRARLERSVRSSKS